jgi:Gpi18-like mannosyltransferase
LLAVFLRIFITFLFLQSYSSDFEWLTIEGSAFLKDHAHYFSYYFPFFTYLGSLAVLLRNIIHPTLFLKFVFSFFDVLTVLMVYLISNKNSTIALIYALNPVTLVDANIHGQFDVVPLFFLMWGIYLFKTNKIYRSIIAISFGIFTKTWPFLFIFPLIRKTKHKLIWTFIIIIPIVAVLFHSLVFKVPINKIIFTVKDYRGVFGVWGVTQIIKFFQPDSSLFYQQLARRIFLLSFLLFVLLTKEKNYLKGILIEMIIFFIIASNFGIQWLSWFVPLLIIIRPSHWQLVLFTVSVYTAIGFAGDVYPAIYNHTNTIIVISGILTWLSLVLIFAKNFKKEK